MTQVPDQAFADALLAQSSWLRGLVRSLVEDTARIDDVCQATMLQAWKHQPAHNRSLRPWLARVAQNLSRQLGWRERQRPERESRTSAGGLEPSAADVVDRVAWQQTMVGLVMALDEPYRSSILLRYWEDSPPREVARRMKVPVETVRTRIKRGLAILRTQLDRRTGDRQAWVTALLPLARFEGTLLPLTAVLIMTKKFASIAAILVAFFALGYLFLGEGTSLPSMAPELRQAGEGVSLPLEGATQSSTGVAKHRELVASRNLNGSVAIEDDPIIAASLCGFRGRIIDSAGGSLESCEVRIHRFSIDRLIAAGLDSPDETGNSPGIQHHAATTDADGRFMVDGLWPHGMYVLVGSSSSHGRLLRLLDSAPGPGQIVDLGDLVLSADAVISGTVVDENGEPVDGARIRAVDLPASMFAVAKIERFDPNGSLLLRDWMEEIVGSVVSVPLWMRDLYAELPIATAFSDAEGRFRVIGVMPGENALLVDHQQWMPTVKVGVQARSRVALDIGNISLRQGEEFLGQVVDAHGVAVAGAELLVAPTSPVMVVDFAGDMTTTDDKGLFRFGGLPTGRVSVAVRRSPAHEWHRIEPQPITRDAVVKLPAICELDLIVHSLIGSRIEELQVEMMRGQLGRQAVTVRAMGWRSAVDLGDRVTRQSEDLWNIADLEPGPYVVAVTSAGHARALRSLVLPIMDPVEFELTAEQIHEVHVVGRNGASVGNAEVYAEPHSVRDHEDAPLPVSFGRTGVDGRLRISGLSHPVLRVTVSHPAYGMVAVLVPRAQRELEVMLDRPGAIDGQILEDGRAPQQSDYTILISQDERHRDGVVKSTPSLVAVDRDGRFVVEGLQPGIYILSVVKASSSASSLGGLVGVISGFNEEDAPETSVIVRADERTEARISIGPEPTVGDPTARLVGTVFLDGVPHAGMQIRLRTYQGVDVAQTETGVDGIFDTGLVPADTYRVSVYSPLDSEHVLHVERYELLAGKTERMSVEINTAGFAGQVFDAEGRPAARAIVDIMRISTDGPGILLYRAYCDGQGKFKKKLMPVGPYSLRASLRNPSAVAPELRINLMDGEKRMDLRIDLHTGFDLRGFLDRDAYGLSDAGELQLRLSREDPIDEGRALLRMIAKTSLGSDGEFEFTGLSSGSYTISIETATGKFYEHKGSIQIEDWSLEELELVPVAQW